MNMVTFVTNKHQHETSDINTIIFCIAKRLFKYANLVLSS